MLGQGQCGWTGTGTAASPFTGSYPQGCPFHCCAIIPRDLRGLSQPCSRLRQASVLQHGRGAAAQPNQPQEQLLAIHTVSLSCMLWWLSVRSLQTYILVHGLILTFLSHCWVPTTTGMVLQSAAWGSSLPSFCTKPELCGHSLSTSHTAGSCRPGF